MSDSEMEKEIIEGLKPAEREPAQKALPIPNGLVGLVNHEQPCHRAVNFTAQYANLETVKPSPGYWISKVRIGPAVAERFPDCPSGLKRRPHTRQDQRDN